MAQYLRRRLDESVGYHGLEWIFEFTNQDGALTTWNCGQAALATFLTHHGAMDPVLAPGNMAWLERHYPPDQFGGWLGTGRHRVERALHGFGIEVGEVRGVDAVRQELEHKNPVLLMIGMPSGRLLGFDLPGGHWMVAYGYDDAYVHLTNQGTMTWAEIEDGWRALSARWIGMNGRGLARRLNGPEPAA